MPDTHTDLFVGAYPDIEAATTDFDGLAVLAKAVAGGLKQTSTKPLPTGEVTVKMLFESDEPRPGSGGNITLWSNGEQIGEERVDKTIPIAPSSYAGMDIGRDNGLVVDLDYEDRAPYAFTGALKHVVFDLKPVGTHDQEKALHEHASIHAVAHGVSA